MPIGSMVVDSSHHWNQWVDHNCFSPLSDLDNGMGFCYEERDDFTEVSSESRDQWCNPQAKLVPSSSLDGVELI